MAGTDLKAERKDLYAPKLGVFVDIVVPPMTFLAIDGSGDPNLSEDYRHAIEALFSASYAAKFVSKRELHRDYVVLPLEGQWWAEDMAAFHTRDKASWSWRMMIRQPAWLGAEVLSEVVRIAEEKGAVAASQLRPYTLDEGRCVQTLHVGSYDDEGPSTCPTARRAPASALAQAKGSPPRDLSQRRPPDRASKAAHHPASTSSNSATAIGHRARHDRRPS
ncbi:MAG: GyrI-like domain-containing protein [Nocardioidaceae bacterium]